MENQHFKVKPLDDSTERIHEHDFIQSIDSLKYDPLSTRPKNSPSQNPLPRNSSNRPMSAFPSKKILPRYESNPAFQNLANRPLSAEAKNDIAFVFDHAEGKQLLQGWRKLFYNTAKLSGTHKTQRFYRRGTGMLGSKCPVTPSVSVKPTGQRPMSARVNGGGVILLRPRVPINTYKMHQTLFDIAKDEIIASSVLDTESKFSYGELCKIARATSPVELLRAIARSEPGGVAHEALKEINKSAYNSLLRKNAETKRTAFRNSVKEDNVILEESDDTSIVKARQYDKNDPDIQYLSKFVTERDALNAVSQNPQSENYNQAEDDYIKDADEEDEALYNGFDDAQNAKAVKAFPQRSIKSAHPNSLSNHLTEPTKKELPPSLQQPAIRPTTVPLAVVDEKLENPPKRNARRFQYKGLRTSKSAKGSAFSIIGKTAKLCPRSPTAPRKLDDLGGTGPYMLNRVASSKTIYSTTHNNTESQQEISTKLYNTAATIKSFMSDEDPAKKAVQQINLVTDPYYQARPSTAMPKMESRSQRNVPLVVLQERPMSAQVPAGSFIQRSMAYVPTNYMRPFAKHRRPISAAINLQANSDKLRTQKIDPERTRTKYLKYLRDLEKEAKEFVIEEDDKVTLVQDKKQSKPKSLLHRAKRQRKNVRLKKGSKLQKGPIQLGLMI